MIEADKVKQIDSKISYLLAQEKKVMIINLVQLWITLLKSGKRFERLIGGPLKVCNSTPLMHTILILSILLEIVHLSNPLGLL